MESIREEDSPVFRHQKMPSTCEYVESPSQRINGQKRNAYSGMSTVERAAGLVTQWFLSDIECVVQMEYSVRCNSTNKAWDARSQYVYGVRTCEFLDKMLPGRASVRLHEDLSGRLSIVLFCCSMMRVHDRENRGF